jgi:hypothetical protein
MSRTRKALDTRLRVALVALPLLAAIVAVPLAWYLISPLFITQRVDEGFPAATAATPPADTIAGRPAGPTAAPAPTGGVAAPAISSGAFKDADAAHKGEGKATIFTLPEGGRVLRFEDFKVTNGPDLYVYLSAHPAPRDTSQLHEGAAFEVARLKGNAGNQNYELPADLDPARYKSVVIYCKRFSVVFSTAALTPGAAAGIVAGQATPETTAPTVLTGP